MGFTRRRTKEIELKSEKVRRIEKREEKNEMKITIALTKLLVVCGSNDFKSHLFF